MHRTLRSVLLVTMIAFAAQRSAAILVRSQFNVLKTHKSNSRGIAFKRTILSHSRQDTEKEISQDDSNLPLHVVNVINEQPDLDWDDRIRLQSRFSLLEKGWTVDVEWRQTPFGVGLFALQDIPADTVLRKGVFGRNLVRFHSTEDIEQFCANGKNLEEYDARLRYVSDYLWGFRSYGMDEQGYLVITKGENDQHDQPHDVMAMWVPGNGLNHSPQPSMVYRTSEGGIDFVALKDIAKDEEILDDYRRHGIAPKWLKDFGEERNLTLNFVGCNDFVIPDASTSSS